MTNVLTVGSAGATFATWALLDSNLQGSAGLKDTAVIKLHNLGVPWDGYTFDIQTSASRMVFEPATGAAFWEHASAATNRVVADPAYGVTISGKLTVGIEHTLSGLMFTVSGHAYKTALESYRVGGTTSAIRNFYNNCVFDWGSALPSTSVHINLLGSNTSHVLTNCVFYYKGAAAGGTMLYAAATSVEANHCTFIARSGGGTVTAIKNNSYRLRVRNSLFINCTIDACAATSSFGFNNVSTLSSANSTFLAGMSPFYGGATALNEVKDFSTLYDVRLTANAQYAKDHGGSARAVHPERDILQRYRYAPHDIGAYDIDGSSVPQPASAEEPWGMPAWFLPGWQTSAWATGAWGIGAGTSGLAVDLGDITGSAVGSLGAQTVIYGTASKFLDAITFTGVGALAGLAALSGERWIITPTSGPANLTVNLTGYVSGSASRVRFAASAGGGWDVSFGATANATVQSTYTYTASGNYQPVFEVSDGVNSAAYIYSTIIAVRASSLPSIGGGRGGLDFNSLGGGLAGAKTPRAAVAFGLSRKP